MTKPSPTIQKILDAFKEEFPTSMEISDRPGSYVILRSDREQQKLELFLADKLQEVERETASQIIKAMQKIDSETWEWDRGDDSIVLELRKRYGLSHLKSGEESE